MSLFEKIIIIVVPTVCAWVLCFAVSLLINNSMWWLNALITFVMVGITVANMTTWRGSEYDPDMMP
jgi:phosphoglycerol transferase MdoB-like AlkP superfamily enzyme